MRIKSPDIWIETDIRGFFYVFRVSLLIDKRSAENFENYVKIMIGLCFISNTS